MLIVIQERQNLPRKVTGEKLEKVISTKIPTKKFELFEKYARQYYIGNKIKQPTVSALLRALINSWLAARERRNGQINTQANALPGQSFKPEERLKYLNVDRLSQEINNAKSSKNTHTHLSALKGWKKSEIL
jgi:hypothetical protein